MSEENGQPAEEAAPAPEGNDGGESGGDEQSAPLEGNEDVGGEASDDVGASAGGDKQPPTTALTDPGGDDAPASPSTWPKDWRTEMAKISVGKGEGEAFDKELKRLERMKSPADVWKSYRNIEKKASQAPKAAESTPFPADGTDEEKAAWRQEKGIPADGYDVEKIELPDGLIIGNEDKKMVDRYLKAAHEGNKDPGRVKEDLSTYFEIRDAQIAERKALDADDNTDARDNLRDEYGSEFQGNVAAAFGLLETAPDAVRDSLLAARLPNGKLLGNDADTIRFLIGLASEVNPAAPLVPGGTGDSLKTVEGRITEIENVMSNDRKAYFADEGMQTEYEKLVTARDKIKKRGGA